MFLQWLATIHSDPAWAIVNLFERARKEETLEEHQRPAAELVQLPNRRALIVLEPQLVRDIVGISLIPLGDGRALLSLPDGQGLADLELAVIDRLASSDLSECHRQELEALREKLSDWRQSAGLTFRTRSIIVADPSPTNQRANGIPHLKVLGRRSRLSLLWLFSTSWYDWCELSFVRAVSGFVIG